MSLKKTIYLSFTAIIIAVAMISCQGGNSGNSSNTAADSMSMKELSQDVKEVVYPLPTPFEMTKLLNDIGAKYAASSLNSADKADKYFTEKSKAINLGVYGADLAYAATYDQKQDVKIYSKALKTLLDELGISVDYSNMLSEEFKEKVNNKDTLTSIITTTFYNTYKYLNDKSNPDLAVMMVSGMWVELMYISTHISENTFNNSSLVSLISKQKDSYEKLMSLLSAHNQNKDIKELEEKLSALKPAFDQVEKGLTEKDYTLILKTIQEVRKSLV